MNKQNKTAFTLVEVLLSMVILGVLMAAVAFAFDASVTNYKVNEGISRAANTGRQTLLRITNDVRTAQAVGLLGVPGIGNDSHPSRLTLMTADGKNVTYRFDLAAKTLYLITNDDTTDADYVLCRNVTAMTFYRSTVPDSAPVAIRNVRIVMTIVDADSGVTQTLAAAAVVRRNLPST
jgi:prepilin-type N-terminal cleavage/methylation domain-containing protein